SSPSSSERSPSKPRPTPRLSTTSTRIPSTWSSCSCRSRKNTGWRYLTKTRKRFKPSEPPGTTSRRSSASPPEPKLPQPDEPLQKLQRTLRVRFHEPALLRQALTHRSYNNEHPESGSADNERLEHL